MILHINLHIDGLRCGVEVCADGSVDELHRRGRHAARPLQHDPHAQVSALPVALDQGLAAGRQPRPHGERGVQETDLHPGKGCQFESM